MKQMKEIFKRLLNLTIILFQILPIVFLAYVELYGWAIILCVFMLYQHKLDIANLKKEALDLKKENEFNLMWMQKADDWMQSMINAHEENIKWINDVSQKHNSLVVLHQDLHQKIFSNAPFARPKKIDKPN